MGKKNSGAQATGSNHGSRRGKGGRGGSRNARSYRERNNVVDKGEGRSDSVIRDEEERGDQLSTGTQ
jgi:pre-rRNA-processing protein TSR3